MVVWSLARFFFFSHDDVGKKFEVEHLKLPVCEA
jgi:hypothetical protein